MINNKGDDEADKQRKKEAAERIAQVLYNLGDQLFQSEEVALQEDKELEQMVYDLLKKWEEEGKSRNRI